MGVGEGGRAESSENPTPGQYQLKSTTREQIPPHCAATSPSPPLLSQTTPLFSLILSLLLWFAGGCCGFLDCPLFVLGAWSPLLLGYIPVTGAVLGVGIWNARVIPPLLYVGGRQGVGEGRGLHPSGHSFLPSAHTCQASAVHPVVSRSLIPSRLRGAVFSNSSVLLFHLTPEPCSPSLHVGASHFLPPTQVPLPSVGVFIPKRSCHLFFGEGHMSNYCVFPSLNSPLSPPSHHRTYRSKVMTDLGQTPAPHPSGWDGEEQMPRGHHRTQDSALQKKEQWPPCFACLSLASARLGNGIIS